MSHFALGYFSMAEKPHNQQNLALLSTKKAHNKDIKKTLCSE